MGYFPYQATLGALSGVGNTLSQLSEQDTRNRQLASENALRTMELGLKGQSALKQGDINLLQTQSEINQRGIENARQEEQLGFQRARFGKEKQDWERDEELDREDTGFNLLRQGFIASGMSDVEANKALNDMITPSKNDSDYDRLTKPIIAKMLPERTTLRNLRALKEYIYKEGLQQAGALQRERIQQAGMNARSSTSSTTGTKLDTQRNKMIDQAQQWASIWNKEKFISPDSEGILKRIQQYKANGIEFDIAKSPVKQMDDEGNSRDVWIYNVSTLPEYGGETIQNNAPTVSIDPQKRAFIETVAQSVPDWNQKTQEEKTMLLNSAYQKQFGQSEKPKASPKVSPEKQVGLKYTVDELLKIGEAKRLLEEQEQSGKGRTLFQKQSPTGRLTPITAPSNTTGIYNAR
jgi:hypothetical protein